jgi:hypothetical protein
MKELDEDRELARQLKQPSAAIAATVAQAKLAGLIVDRKEVGQPGEFENMKAEELAEVLARNAAGLGLKVSVKSHSSSKDRLADGLERRLGQWLRALNPSGIGRLTCGATGRVTCHVRLHAMRWPRSGAEFGCRRGRPSGADREDVDEHGDSLPHQRGHATPKSGLSAPSWS